MNIRSVKYKEQAEELVSMLNEDQAEKKVLARAYLSSKDKNRYREQMTEQAKRARQRAARMMQILDEVGEPTLGNIGEEAAMAVSVLAVHSSLDTMKQILSIFAALYSRNKKDTYYQAIPSLTDWILTLERKPQMFGTQWLSDQDDKPFLPPVEDFEHVNARRSEYGIEPLRWPKYLAIPESKQPWLRQPLSDLVMREPTEKEYQAFSQDYLV